MTALPESLRVLHIMDQSLPRISGYSVRAKYLLEEQVHRGHMVEVLTGPSQGRDAIDEEINGVRYRRSRVLPLERVLLRLKCKPLILGRIIRRHLRQATELNSFDLLHAHTPFALALPAVAVVQQRELPLVYEKRNLWEESAHERGKFVGRWPFYGWSRRLDHWATSRADAIIAITEPMRQDVVNRGISADRVVVVENGVDTTVFQPQEPSARLQKRFGTKGKLTVGFIGSFFAFEGLPLLLRAFELFTQTHANAALILVGGGEDQARLQAEIRTRALGNCCFLTGKVTHSKIQEYYSIMDILVYPRLRSRLTDLVSPLKPLEAMAMGKAVLASDVGGLTQLLEDGDTGILFRAGDAAHLAARLGAVSCASTTLTDIGRRAREYVVEQRQWRQMADGYQVAYAKALAERG